MLLIRYHPSKSGTYLIHPISHGYRFVYPFFLENPLEVEENILFVVETKLIPLKKSVLFQGHQNIDVWGYHLTMNLISFFPIFCIGKKFILI